MAIFLAVAAMIVHKMERLAPPFLMERGPLSKEMAGFTLIELMVVLIIVSILAGLAIPNFSRTRERALDKEAQTAQRLIQAAERVYLSKFGKYYPDTPPANLTQINQNLQLELSSSSWDFNITAASSATFTAEARRNTGAVRTWSITENTSLGPTCAGINCP